MEQIMEFAGNHVLLVSAFFVVLSLIVINLATDPAGKNAVDPHQATELINHEEAVIVDVRTPAEFRGGHIINSINIPLSGFKDQLGQLEKYKGRPIIACCRSGSRSGSIVSTLRGAGFESAHNLRGGIMAWQSANLPVKRG